MTGEYPMGEKAVELLGKNSLILNLFFINNIRKQYLEALPIKTTSNPFSLPNSLKVLSS